MAEDDFDPFAEHDEDAPVKPRVNLSYVNETEASRKVLGVSAWSRFIGKFRFSVAGFIFFGKLVLVAAIILAYPIMSALSHQINDRTIEPNDSRYWAVPEIGVTSVLIGRELDGPGWASDRHPWHPQSRLTALPAWQEGILEAIASYGRLIIQQIEDQRDPDLIAAIRLLDPADGQDTTSRLIAASEALSRYDDRVAGGVTIAPSGPDTMALRLALVQDWARARHVELAEVASPGDGWIASTQAIEAVYRAKATAHVTHELLLASLRKEQSLLAKYEAEGAYKRMLAAWRRAATLGPLFVANQGSDAASGVNHPAIIAFHLEEARRATQALEAVFKAPPPTAPEDTGTQNTEALANLTSN